MLLFGGRVNPPSNISFSDGAEVNALYGKSAEQIIAALHGNLYTQAYRGNMFHGYSTTPAAIPVTSTTAPNFILFNPRGSGVNAILVHYCVGWVSGTNTEGNIQLGVILNAPAAIATGSSISAFTNGPVLNANFGNGNATKLRFGTAATLAAATTQFFPFGLSNMKLAANNAASVTLIYAFEGTAIVSPGTAIFSCASAASGALYNERLCWYEFPA
jgi:hypothetical protein